MLLWIDGFDEQAPTLTTMGYVDHELPGGYRTGANTAFNRGAALVIQDASSPAFTARLRKYFGNQTEVIVGFRFRARGPADNYTILSFGFLSGSEYPRGVTIQRNLANGFSVTYNRENLEDSITNNNVISYAYTRPQLYVQDEWCYVEIRIKVGVFNGEIEIRVNEEQVFLLTDVKTIPQGAGFINTLEFLHSVAGALNDTGYWLDDFYILNTFGGVHSTFLGDTAVLTRFPTGNGSSNDFGVEGAATNWEAVDENPPDGDTSYTFSDEAGDRDLFTFDPLPDNVVDVLAVQVSTRARKEGASTANYKVMAKIETDESFGPSIFSGTSYDTKFVLLEQQPADIAWSKLAFEDLEIGVELE